MRTHRMALCAVVAAVAAVVALGAPAAAAAAGKKDQAAIAELEAAYQPTGKLAGAARTQQACSDAAKLHAAADAVPHKHAPSGAPVDDTTWSDAVGDLAAVLGKLVEVCKAPDHKISIDLQGKKFETADQIVERVDLRVRTVIDRAKPRALPPAMKKFQSAMVATRAGKQLCAQEGKLAKLVAELAAPPAGADAARWQPAAAALKAAVDEVKQFGCSTPRGADEEIAGALVGVHDHYYELVVLVPPRA
jgi:hypothetical protein